MKKITGMNKKYKWMLLLASLFLVLAGMFAYARKDKTYAADPYYQIKDSEGNVVDDSYTMRRSNDTFTIATWICASWRCWSLDFRTTSS